MVVVGRLGGLGSGMLLFGMYMFMELYLWWETSFVVSFDTWSETWSEITEMWNVSGMSP